MRVRHTARVIILDAANRVLLLRFVMQRSDGPFAFWVTPGGALEPGEEPLAGARRELMEELGLDLPLTGPVHRSGGAYEWLRENVVADDQYFLARFDGEAAFTGVEQSERDMHRETRWFAADELAHAGDPVYPRDLAEVLARLSVRTAG